MWLKTGNPTVGFGGGTVFQEITEQNNQTSVQIDDRRRSDEYI